MGNSSNRSRRRSRKPGHKRQRKIVIPPPSSLLPDIPSEIEALGEDPLLSSPISAVVKVEPDFQNGEQKNDEMGQAVSGNSVHDDEESTFLSERQARAKKRRALRTKISETTGNEIEEWPWGNSNDLSFATDSSDDEPLIRKARKNRAIIKNPWADLFLQGLRFVDFNILAWKMWCESCNEPLCLRNMSEDRLKIGELDLRCQWCAKVITVPLHKNAVADDFELEVQPTIVKEEVLQVEEGDDLNEISLFTDAPLVEEFECVEEKGGSEGNSAPWEPEEFQEMGHESDGTDDETEMVQSQEDNPNFKCSDQLQECKVTGKSASQENLVLSPEPETDDEETTAWLADSTLDGPRPASYLKTMKTYARSKRSHKYWEYHEDEVFEIPDWACKEIKCFPYQCGYCYEQLESQHLFYKHVYGTHEDFKRFICWCKTRCFSRNELRSHIISKHDPKGICHFCGLTFVSGTLLRVHLASNHDIGEKITCKICDQVYKSQFHLRVHESYVHCTELFECNQCGKSFNQKIKLKGHMALHTNKFKFICPICSAKFTRKDNMDIHIKNNHHYVCSVCAENFTSAQAAKEHVKQNHSEEEILSTAIPSGFQRVTKFCCSVCGMCLASKQALQFHEKRHSDVS